MSKITLAEFLGWEDEHLYEYNGQILKTLNNKLLAVLDFGSHYVKWGFSELQINELCELRNANKLDIPKYNLKYKDKSNPTYFNYDFNGNFMIGTKTGLGEFKTKFRTCEIEEIEASGFDLRNFEKVEVEDD